MSRHQPGDIIHTTRRGIKIQYLPAMGSSARYLVLCPHDEFVNARTLADAREDARLVDEWCPECAAKEGMGNDDV